MPCAAICTAFWCPRWDCRPTPSTPESDVVGVDDVEMSRVDRVIRGRPISSLAHYRGEVLVRAIRAGVLRARRTDHWVNYGQICSKVSTWRRGSVRDRVAERSQTTCSPNGYMSGR